MRLSNCSHRRRVGFYLFALLSSIFPVWVLSAEGNVVERDNREISSHITAVTASATGMTLCLDLPPRPPGSFDFESGIVAIPPGREPSITILNYTLSFWKEGTWIETIGPIDHQEEPGRLQQYVAPRRLIALEPLGLVRRVRLARVRLDTSYQVPGSSGQRYQVNRLEFRLDYPSRVLPIAPEPDFGHGYPSGFHGIFQTGLLNSAYLPDGVGPIPRDKERMEVLPYQEHPALRLSVTAAGYYGLSPAGLMDLEEGVLKAGQPALFHSRREAPLGVFRRDGTKGWFLVKDAEEPVQPEDLFVFYAPVPDSPYSPESVYFLTRTGGTERFSDETETAWDLNGETAALTAPVVFVAEENRVFSSKGENFKDKTQHEYWVWQKIDAESPFETELRLPGPLYLEEATPPRIHVELSVLPEVSHRNLLLDDYVVEFGTARVRGEEISSRIDGSRRHRQTLQFRVSAKSIAEQWPRVPFRMGVSPEAVQEKSERFALDKITLTYRKSLVADERGFCLTPDRNDRRWRVRLALGPDSSRPDLIVARNKQGFFLLPSAVQENFLKIGLPAALDGPVEQITGIVGPERLPEPDWEVSPVGTLHRSHEQGADLIVVTHPELAESIEPLADFRRSQGYRVTTVLTPEIYKTFGDGSLNPENIRTFLRHAWLRWERPAPTYVLLFGEARWDYKDHFGYGLPNHVPSYHAAPAYPSDNLYACVSGDDPLPDLVIARLSVADVTAAETVVRKVVGYEREMVIDPWVSRVLFVSDNERVFEETSVDQIQNKIPPWYEARHLRVRDYPLVDDFLAPEQSRIRNRSKYSLEGNRALMAELERGVILWEYYGHGSPNSFSPVRIFFGGGSDYSHVKQMTNHDRLPVLVALTCSTIQFDYAGEVGPKWALSMGEELLVQEGGGAVAVFGATGKGYTTHHILLNTGFHRALFRQGLRRVGDAMTAAKIMTYAGEKVAEPLDMFGLLGDGLTELPLPEPTIPVGLEGEAQLESDTVRRLRIQADLRRMPLSLTGSGPEQASGWFFAQQGGDFELLHEEIRERVRNRRYVFDLEPAAELPPGRGRYGFWMHSGQDRGEWGNLYAGGGVFEVPAKAPPEVEEVTGILPDLSVAPGGVRIEPESPQTGQTVFFDVEIGNRGEAPAQRVQARAYDQNPDEGGKRLEDRLNWEEPEIPYLGPGEIRTLRLRWDPIGNPGWNEVWIRVDPLNRIAESDVNNNDVTAEFYVRTKADIAFATDDFRLMPSADPALVELAAAVRNIGETTSASSPIQVFVYDSPEAEEAIREIVIPQTRPIPPQKRLRFSLSIPSVAERVRLIADPEMIQEEETHTNNTIDLLLHELEKGEKVQQSEAEAGVDEEGALRGEASSTEP